MIRSENLKKRQVFQDITFQVSNIQYQNVSIFSPKKKIFDPKKGCNCSGSRKKLRKNTTKQNGQPNKLTDIQ